MQAESGFEYIAKDMAQLDYTGHEMQQHIYLDKACPLISSASSTSATHQAPCVLPTRILPSVQQTSSCRHELGVRGAPYHRCRRGCHRPHHHHHHRQQQHLHQKQQQHHDDDNHHRQQEQQQQLPHHGYHNHLIDELRSFAKLKAEIVAHPLFDNILRAHVQCLSVGMASHHMHGLEAQLANRHSIILKYLMLGRDVDDHDLLPRPAAAGGQQPKCGRTASAGAVDRNREIDTFMESYLQLLVEWRGHLEEFFLPTTVNVVSALREIEESFKDLTGVTLGRATSVDDDDIEDHLSCDGHEESWAEYFVDAVDQAQLLDHVRKELKEKLKEGYKESITAMRDEILRKRQAGKLPGDVTALKRWWEAHSRWPYPSEEDKKKLMEETGLEMRQINNWFINHRKRHWIDRTPPPKSKYIVDVSESDLA